MCITRDSKQCHKVKLILLFEFPWQISHGDNFQELVPTIHLLHLLFLSNFRHSQLKLRAIISLKYLKFLDFLHPDG